MLACTSFINSHLLDDSSTRIPATGTSPNTDTSKSISLEWWCDQQSRNDEVYRINQVENVPEMKCTIESEWTRYCELDRKHRTSNPDYTHMHSSWNNTFSSHVANKLNPSAMNSLNTKPKSLLGLSLCDKVHIPNKH